MILPAAISLAFALMPAIPQLSAAAAQPAPSAHVTNTFQFEIDAPLVRVAPLFGPNGERAWGGEHWNPVFLYPQPAADTQHDAQLDTQGAVFTVQHGSHTSVWVTTVFDLPGGRMQYVAIVPGVVASVIDVNLTVVDLSHTVIRVTYARTALDPSQNNTVESLGEGDRKSGPEWQAAIEAALHRQRK